jgi:hypothetical protein
MLMLIEHGVLKDGRDEGWKQKTEKRERNLLRISDRL